MTNPPFASSWSSDAQTMPIEFGDRAPHGMDPSGEQLHGEAGSEPQGCVSSVSTSMLPSDSVERVLGSRSRTANLRSSSASHLAVNKVSWSSNIKTTPGARTLRTARISGPAHVKCTEANPASLVFTKMGNHLSLNGPSHCMRATKCRTK